MVEKSYILRTSLKKARSLIEVGGIGKPQQMRKRFGSRVERSVVLETDRPTADHRGWRMASRKAGGAVFYWVFNYCVHFFATLEYFVG
jgi:predicted dehydrogenase